jgi:hypothetical protein
MPCGGGSHFTHTLIENSAFPTGRLIELLIDGVADKALPDVRFRAPFTAPR